MNRPSAESAARSLDKQARLLDASERIFFTRGELALTVRQIAVEAEATSQSVYTYFGSRGAMVGAMYDRAVASMERLFRPVAEQLRSAGDDRRYLLHDLVWTYRRYCVHHPAHFLMLVVGSGPSGTDPTAVRSLQHHFVQLVEGAQMAGGIVPTTMSDGPIRTAVAAVNGFVDAELRGYLDPNDDVDALFEELVTRLWPTIPRAAAGSSALTRPV